MNRKIILLFLLGFSINSSAIAQTFGISGSAGISNLYKKGEIKEILPDYKYQFAYSVGAFVDVRISN